MKDHTRKPPKDQKLLSYLRNLWGIIDVEILNWKILRLNSRSRELTNPIMLYIKMTALNICYQRLEPDFENYHLVANKSKITDFSETLIGRDQMLRYKACSFKILCEIIT